MKGQWCWKSCLWGHATGTALCPAAPWQVLEVVQSPAEGLHLLPWLWAMSHTKCFCQRGKELFSLSPPCKTAGKEHASLKRTWNHCFCLLILYRGRSVVRSEGCVYPGLSIWAPFICPAVWWCIYNSLFSEVSRGVKSRCICEEEAEDRGTSVCAMAYPALQF